MNDLSAGNLFNTAFGTHEDRQDHDSQEGDGRNDHQSRINVKARFLSMPIALGPTGAHLLLVAERHQRPAASGHTAC